MKAFYKDYVEMPKGEDFGTQKMILAKRYFDDKLYSLLREEAQFFKQFALKEKCDDCVPDVDSFTGSRDRLEPVTSSQLVQKDSKTHVRVRLGKGGDAGVVIVNLKKEPQGWKIRNFIYSDEPQDDLMNGLAKGLNCLREGRCQLEKKAENKRPLKVLGVVI